MKRIFSVVMLAAIALSSCNKESYHYSNLEPGYGILSLADASISVSEETETQAPDLESAQEVHDEPKLTLEDVRSVLSEISANGHGAEIRELLKKYGQTKLSEIDPKDYPALLKDAEVLK